MADGVAERLGPGGEALGPHGRAGVVASGVRFQVVSEQAAVRVDDHDLPQPVQGALFAAGERCAAVERSGADGARTEAPDTDGGLTDGPGRGSVEQLRAVVVGAGPGGGACERAGIAETVPGLVFVSPAAVVEVRVVIGDPGAVEPVDRPAPVGCGPGGVGTQPGVSARQAQHRRLRYGNHPTHIREIAGFNDVISGCSNEVAVVFVARAGGGLRIGSDEQKAEGVADSEVVGISGWLA